MIISEKQIMQLLTSLKEHAELLIKVDANKSYREYLCRLYIEIIDQQHEELKEIND